MGKRCKRGAVFLDHMMCASRSVTTTGHRTSIFLIMVKFEHVFQAIPYELSGFRSSFLKYSRALSSVAYASMWGQPYVCQHPESTDTDLRRSLITLVLA